jgi:hypothetical protein
MPNFEEVFKLETNHCLKSYFQPKLLLKGMSLCSIDFPKFKNTIKSLKQALSYTEKQAPNSLSVLNSPMSEMFSVNDESDKTRLESIIDSTFKAFGINRY